MIKYYITINKYNEILKPYSNKDGFISPINSIEISEKILKDYLDFLKKGYLVKFINNQLVTDVLENKSSTVIENKKNHIFNELEKTDRVYLPDSGLSDEKKQEFTIYRENLRDTLHKINNNEDIFGIILPDAPTYE